MSASPEQPPPSLPPPERRSGCATAFMALFGVILLLPGLCAVLFGFNEMTSSSTDPVVTLLVTIGLVLGGVGVALIWSAIRGRRA